MDIKEIRKLSKLTQKQFAEKYHIPLQTLKQWESDKSSSSFRIPPFYLNHLLERLVKIDYVPSEYSDTKIVYIISAAEHSKYNGKHWFRYLRKEFDKDTIVLTKDQMNQLLLSNELTLFQKISLKRAMEKDSLTHEYLYNLNRKTQTPMLKKVMRKHND